MGSAISEPILPWSFKLGLRNRPPCDFGHVGLSVIEGALNSSSESIGSTALSSECQRLHSMWSSNKRRESETDRRRRVRDEGREEPGYKDGKRQAGMWMVFFLGAAAVSVFLPTVHMSVRPPFLLFLTCLKRQPSIAELSKFPP